MLVVLADDITGAAEIAGVCLRFGISLGFSVDSIPVTETEVHVITTDSRSVSEAQAFNIHKDLARQLSENFPDVRIFKKCDSALRGHVITELVALSQNPESCLIVAANPLTGRCIKDGKYFIADQLIENTGFATDPDFPATTSDVSELVASRSSYLSSIHSVYTGLIPEVLQSGFYIPNCTSVDDLKKYATEAPRFSLVAGSAVFFEQFLLSIGYSLRIQKPYLPPLPDSYLFIPGSFHPSSREFRRRLTEKGCRVHYFPEILLQPAISESELKNWVDFLLNEWKQNPRLGIAISDSKVDFEGSQQLLKQRLSWLVNTMVRSNNIQHVYIEGGATAYDIFNKAGLSQFKPMEELSPGVVSLLSLHADGAVYTIKPGSYQWPENYFGF